MTETIYRNDFEYLKMYYDSTPAESIYFSDSDASFDLNFFHLTAREGNYSFLYIDPAIENHTELNPFILGYIDTETQLTLLVHFEDEPLEIVITKKALEV